MRLDHYDDVLGFNAAGRTGDSPRIWHRSGGLTYDGTIFWPIGGSPLELYRLSHSGVLADSIQVDVPDAHSSRTATVACGRWSGS